MSIKALLDTEIEGRIAEIHRLHDAATDTKDKRVLNLERGRLEAEQRRRKGLKEGFPDPRKIPHVFFNVMLTKPATKELADYLMRTVEEHPESLRYLYDKSQEYKAHGSGANITRYDRWLTKLQSDIRRQKWQ